MPKPANKVAILPRELGTLAGALPPAEPGTLFVLGANGGMSVAPDANFTLTFGRNEPEVHVCVGKDDTRVSRRQGYIRHEHSRWLLYNVGKSPIRFPGSRMVLGGHWSELPAAYSPLFVVSPGREHLLEVRIAANRPAPSQDARHEAETDQGKWDLSQSELLVLACLSQRYLRQEPFPQPLTWAAVAGELSELRPEQRWNWRRAARIVSEVRLRLSPHVAGLLESEVPPPVGNTLNHNLIMELLVTSTLRQEHLNLLDGGSTPDPSRPRR